jgi:hypothetical protein
MFARLRFAAGKLRRSALAVRPLAHITGNCKCGAQQVRDAVPVSALYTPIAALCGRRRRTRVGDGQAGISIQQLFFATIDRSAR